MVLQQQLYCTTQAQTTHCGTHAQTSQTCSTSWCGQAAAAHAPLLPSPYPLLLTLPDVFCAIMLSYRCCHPCTAQRRELIGAVDFSQRQQKFAKEQDVLEGSQDVTASLRRTRQLMMQNLEQTHGNISVLGGLGVWVKGVVRHLWCRC